MFVDINPDVCTDPDCFADKVAASVNNQVAEYERKNIPVFRGAEFATSLSDAKNGHGLYVTGATWITAFPRHHNDYKSKRSINTVFTSEELGTPAAYSMSDTNNFIPLYNKDHVQELLEKAGHCDNLLEAFDKKAPQHKSTYSAEPTTQANVVIGGATLSTVAKDPYRERCERQLNNKDVAQKETAFRVALYKKLRQRGFTGFSLQSLREFVKLVLKDNNDYVLPDDLLVGVYPSSFGGSDEEVCNYIDQASIEDVQMILVDLVIGEALSVSQWDIEMRGDDDDRFNTLLAMATAEGIDVDQVRADLDKPTTPEPVDTAVTVEESSAAIEVVATTKALAKRGRKPKDKAEEVPKTPSRVVAWPFPKSASELAATTVATGAV